MMEGSRQDGPIAEPTRCVEKMLKAIKQDLEGELASLCVTLRVCLLWRKRG
jgi:hypothetical protein